MCGDLYKLKCVNDHNKLCLLRGIIEELIPPGHPVLGSTLSEVVKTSDFLRALFYFCFCFLSEGWDS